METKVYNAFFYNTTSGWTYMLEDKVFKEGDIVTDGEEDYRIGEYKFAYPHGKAIYLIPGYNTRDYYVYSVDKCIKNCEGKTLRLKNELQNLHRKLE